MIHDKGHMPAHSCWSSFYQCNCRETQCLIQAKYYKVSNNNCCGVLGQTNGYLHIIGEIFIFVRPPDAWKSTFLAHQSYVAPIFFTDWPGMTDICSESLLVLAERIVVVTKDIYTPKNFFLVQNYDCMSLFLQLYSVGWETVLEWTLKL